MRIGSAAIQLVEMTTLSQIQSLLVGQEESPVFSLVKNFKNSVAPP
jgi:hypothetical protein